MFKRLLLISTASLLTACAHTASPTPAVSLPVTLENIAGDWACEAKILTKEGDEDDVQVGAKYMTHITPTGRRTSPSARFITTVKLADGMSLTVTQLFTSNLVELHELSNNVLTSRSISGNLTSITTESGTPFIATSEFLAQIQQETEKDIREQKKTIIKTSLLTQNEWHAISYIDGVINVSSVCLKK